MNGVHVEEETDQIKALRRALASELGFVMPSIRIQDNMQLEANEYNIYVKEKLVPEKDDEGNVSMIQMNMYKVNIIISDIAYYIQEEMKNPKNSNKY